MNINKQNSCDWVLNPSKRFPGKYYYFNVVTGETVWSLNGAESNFQKNSNSTEQVGDRVHNCPEPVTPPNENTVTSIIFNPRNSYTNASKETYSNAIFPKYINNNAPYFQNIVWAPIPMFVSNILERKATLDQNTQTSEADRDLFIQTCTIPLSQRFASLGNISTITTPIDSNCCVPVKEFHTSTPMKNVWNVTEQVLETANDKYQEGKISQVQYKRKLAEPKLILKESKLKKLSDRDTLRSDSFNRDIENQSLSQHNKVDNSENDKTNEISFKRLDKCDLRYLLQLKRRKSVDIRYEEQGRETKRVSFNLNNYDRYSSDQSNEETVSFKASIPIMFLKKLSKIPTNNDWYISVDEDVLLDDFDFIMHYVTTDNSCKLLIPESIVTYVEELAVGERGGRGAVVRARRARRRLADWERVQVVETEDGASIMEDVIKCCVETMDMGIHVVLITKYEKLEKLAKSFGIHVYNLDHIKNGTKRSTESCNGKNTKNNLFLQSAADFDPFILSKNVHTARSLNKTAFRDSDSTLSDYDKANLNYNKKENINDNAIDICQTIEKLNINDKIFGNIKRVIKNCDAETKISDRNTNDSNINGPFKPIFDHIDGTNQYFNRNNDSIVKFTKRIDNNLFERENSNINVFNDKIRRDLGDDNFTKSNVTILSNDKYTNTGENIWKVVNGENNLKKCEHSDTVEDKLRRFEVEDKTIEENIVLRLDEWICCYVQIMEEFVNYVLQKNVTDNQMPFFLRDGLVHLRDIYLSAKEIRVIIEKLLALCRFCPMKGNLKKDIEPNDFLKILGCGFLLVDSLEGELSEDVGDIKDLLATLWDNVQSGPDEDPEQAESPRGAGDGDSAVCRTKFVKRRCDIVDYLRKHFFEWKICDDYLHEVPENEEFDRNVKILRTFGRNLSTFRIDNKKRISFGNPKQQNPQIINRHTETRIDENTFKANDALKAIGNESLIDENKDKKKSNFDLDRLDYSEIAETMSPEDKRFGDTPTDVVDLTRSDSLPLVHDASDGYDVRDSTADSGFENETHASTFIKYFLGELSASLKLIYTFIDKCITELRDDNVTDETKEDLAGRAGRAREYVAGVVGELRAIIERESSDSVLKSLLLKTGNGLEDKRMTRYRQTVTKCLEQAQILESCLKIMLSVTNNGCDLSVSSTTQINHFNIFE